VQIRTVIKDKNKIQNTITILNTQRKTKYMDTVVIKVTFQQVKVLSVEMPNLTAAGASADWSTAWFPPLLRGADGSPQSTPVGFPPGITKTH